MLVKKKLIFLLKTILKTIFKIDANSFFEVIKYEGSLDYIFLKGQDAIASFY